MNQVNGPIRRTTVEHFKAQDDATAKEYTITQTTIWRRRDDGDPEPPWEPVSLLYSLSDGLRVERLAGGTDTFLARVWPRPIRLRRL